MSQKAKTDRDIDTARGPVIFPAAGTKVNKVRFHIFSTASVGVKKARQNDMDKAADLASKKERLGMH